MSDDLRETEAAKGGSPPEPEPDIWLGPCLSPAPPRETARSAGKPTANRGAALKWAVAAMAILALGGGVYLWLTG